MSSFGRKLNDLTKELVLNDKIRASCQEFVRLPSIKSNLETLLTKTTLAIRLLFRPANGEMARFCFKFFLKFIYNQG